MSIKVMQWLWENSPAKGSELLLLLAIGDCANHDGGGAWPSIASLAKKTRLSERNVHYLLGSLKTRGLLEIDKGAGPRGCNLFRVQGVQGCNPAPGGCNPAYEGVQSSVLGGCNDVHPNRPYKVEPSLEPSTEPSLIAGTQKDGVTWWKNRYERGKQA